MSRSPSRSSGAKAPAAARSRSTGTRIGGGVPGAEPGLDPLGPGAAMTGAELEQGAVAPGADRLDDRPGGVADVLPRASGAADERLDAPRPSGRAGALGEA